MRDRHARGSGARRAGGGDYLSYVLRLWWDGGAAGAWRCSIEDTATRQRRGFADVESLAAYLLDVRPPDAPGATARRLATGRARSTARRRAP